MRLQLLFVAMLGIAVSAFAQTGEHAPKGMTDEAGLPLLSAGTIDMYTPAAVRVNATHGDEMRSATGFFIGPGKLVTARQLLLGSTAAEVVFESGDTLKIESVKAEDAKAGLVVAFVDVPADLKRGLRVSFLDPLIGDVGIAIGSPVVPVTDPPKHEMVGVKLAATAHKDKLKLIRLESLSDTDPADWARLDGGPVIDTYGQVVGVVSVELATEDHPFIAVGAAALHKLVETDGMALAQWSTEGSLASLIETERVEASTRDIGDLERPEGYPPPIEKLDGYDVKPANIVRQADGSLLFDKRYELKGSGTESDPYIATWDLLVSSSETMMPRIDKKSIPERVAMLNGKWVRLGGNVSFPLMMSDPTELLLMLNPWDGCCIGVPPTPYDAVEVGLTDPASEDDVYAAYGAVTGRFLVQPYLVGDWLVGMYVLEDAKLSVEDGGKLP